MTEGIFSGCVFYLDADARLGPASLLVEQKSQDFADTSASDFAASLMDRGARVLHADAHGPFRPSKSRCPPCPYTFEPYSFVVWLDRQSFYCM